MRPGQGECVLELLNGKSVFLGLTTGRGKSLPYKLYTMMKESEGIIVFVAPLTTILLEQAEDCSRFGVCIFYKFSWPFTQVNVFQIACVVISKKTSNAVMEEICLQLIGETPITNPFKIMFLSPEKLASRLDLKSSLNVAINKKLVDLLVLDEAHAASDWGLSFRESYRDMPFEYPQLYMVPKLLLSATFTDYTFNDVATLFNIPDMVKILSEPGRKNISFQVLAINTIHNIKLAVNVVIQLLAMYTKNGGCAVFCHSVDKCKALQEKLAEHDIDSVVYYAALSEEQKEENLRNWFANQPNVVCCTSAIGLGINKPDVELVVHLQMTESISSYYQQAGRAGRAENITATAILLYDSSTEAFFRWKAEEAREQGLVQKANLQLEDVAAMAKYCVNAGMECRQEYFRKCFVGPLEVAENEKKCAEGSRKCDVCLMGSTGYRLRDARSLLTPSRILRNAPQPLLLADLVASVRRSSAVFQLLAIADIKRLILHQIQSGILRDFVTRIDKSNNERYEFFNYTRTVESATATPTSLEIFKLQHTVVSVKKIEKAIEAGNLEATKRLTQFIAENAAQLGIMRHEFMSPVIAKKILNLLPVDYVALRDIFGSDGFENYYSAILNAIN